MLTAALLGTPIDHSLSPVMHNYWLQEAGVDGRYEAIDVADTDEAFSKAIKSLVKQGYQGCNVTLPHKRRAYECADTLSPNARALGAVNTLYFNKGKIHGDNTDVTGFDLALKDHARDLEPGFIALVLGAGGAAPAILKALAGAGAKKIYLCNRTFSKAKELSQKQPDLIQAIEWKTLQDYIPQADVLVNTTALGMSGQPVLSLVLGGGKPSLIVADIVYTPLQTALLEEAKHRGLKHFNGLSMLVYQGMPGFRKWFGAQPQAVKKTKALLVETLQNQKPKPIMLGLTGSIGMGKTTTAELFSAYGIAVWNADEAVHRLYAPNGRAVTKIAERFPDCIKNNAVDRQCLSEKISNDKSVFAWLNQTIHPLVAEDEREFMHWHEGAAAVLLDIPLLFESKSPRRFDAIIVVSAPEDIRRERVLARPGMTPEKLQAILAQQLPEKERLELADYVIWTHRGEKDAAKQVAQVMKDLAEDFPQLQKLTLLPSQSSAD